MSFRLWHSVGEKVVLEQYVFYVPVSSVDVHYRPLLKDVKVSA